MARVKFECLNVKHLLIQLFSENCLLIVDEMKFCHLIQNFKSLSCRPGGGGGGGPDADSFFNLLIWKFSINRQFVNKCVSKLLNGPPTQHYATKLLNTNL